jgi:hypothetical protein
MQEDNPHFQIPVPFVQQPTGLGDVIANITRRFGAQPCAPCKQRQEWLNQQVQLNPFFRR